MKSKRVAILFLLAWAGVDICFAKAPSIPGCTPTVSEFTNSSAAAIPDNSSVSSTIAVSALSGTVIDVDVFTDIDHTNTGDLDITLASPTGTIATITTDNGGTNDNVFAGTYWDDQADPSTVLVAAASGTGFLGNPSTAFQHQYSDGVVATPLVPEEGFAVFNGEAPNGNWILKIVDDTATETGTLQSWRIRVTTCTTAPATKTKSFSNATSQTITDHGLITSVVTASGLGSAVCGVKVTVNIGHTFSNDLEVTLSSPAGTFVTLTDDLGGGNDNVFSGTTFQVDADPGSSIPYSGNPGIVSDHTYTNLSAATPLTPIESFAAVYGEVPNGDWTLSVHDDLAGDTGTFNGWSLELTSCSNDADQDGIADSEDACTGADTDSNSNGIADCLESDLVPVDIKAKRVSGKFQCSFSIKNNGVVAAASSKAEIRFGVASDSTGKVKGTFNVPALAAGAKSAKFTVNKAGAGAHFCRFIADSAGTLTETKENNNTKSKLVG